LAVGLAEDIEIIPEVRNCMVSQSDEMDKAELEEAQKLFDESRLQISEDCPPEYKTKIKNLCFQYADVFSWDPEKLGKVKNFEHTIELTTKTPYYTRQFPFPKAWQPEIREQINKLLKQKVIEESASPYNSPAIFVRKPSGQLRFLLDMRMINLHSIFHGVSLPPIHEILTTISGYEYYVQCDVRSAYFCIGLTPSCRKFTAFNIPNIGSFHYTRLPQGSSSSPAVFVRVINKMLANVHNVTHYMDDIFMFNDSPSQLLETVQEVFKRLRETGLKLSLEKTCLFQKKITALGHCISKEGYSLSPRITQTIETYAVPKTTKQLRSFVGLASFARKFCPKFAIHTEPLMKLLRKGVKFVWLPEHAKAFEYLKQLLIKAPTLRPYNPKLPLKLVTDASTKAISAILLQQEENSDDWVIISYYSRLLTKAESVRPILELELISIIASFKALRYYLLGREFILQCDNRAILYLRNTKNLSPKLARFLLYMEQYRFTTVFVKSENNIADGLSRNTQTQIQPGDFQMPEVICNVVIKEIPDVMKHQKVDRYFGDIYCELEENGTLSTQSRYYEIRDGKLYRKNKMGNSTKYLLCIPEVLKKKVFELLHADKLSGHYGLTKSYNAALERIYFPKMKKYFHDCIKACIVCQMLKRKQKPELVPLTYPEYMPFETVILDQSGPFNVSNTGRNRYILILIDQCTKYAITKAVPTLEADTICEFIFEDVILRYGIPKRLLLDKLPSHTSGVMKELAEKLGIELKFALPLGHHSIGTVERFQDTLQQVIRKYAAHNPASWESYLLSATFSYNTTVHTVLKKTPFELMHGFVARIPVDAYLDLPYNHVSNEVRLKTLELARKDAYKNHEAMFLKRKEKYEKSGRKQIFQVGDRILIQKLGGKRGISKLFTNQFSLRGKIIEVLNPNKFRVEFKNAKNETKIDDFDISRLRHYVPPVEGEKKSRSILRKTNSAIETKTEKNIYI
jgi:hypothetical protein